MDTTLGAVKGLDSNVFNPLDLEQYHAWYQQSLEDPSSFWAFQAKRFLSWQTPFKEVCQWDFNRADIQWFRGGHLNVAYNCIDRHLPEKKNQTALIWEGDTPEVVENISYQRLYEEVCQLANGLKSLGIQKGDRVCIYMPMVPQAAFAMLACARIGAVHTVVFGGFSPNALAQRIEDAQCQCVITADRAIRGGKTIELKQNVDEALAQQHHVNHVIVLKNSLSSCQWVKGRDYDYQQLVADCPKECPCEWLEAEDPLFILYTSGSTGKPKGVLHTQAGYLLYAACTFRYAFDYQPGEIFWCTADVGWITGHSYCVYGPLALGATTLLFGGVPNYPQASRCWEMIERHHVHIFYTAPTAIRGLMVYGAKVPDQYSMASLRILGTVGEPINPEAWRWYHQHVGKQRCEIIDTWWQTETGGIMMAPLPHCNAQKPGCAGLPFFGVVPKLIKDGKEVTPPHEQGELVMTQSWPGQMRGVYQNPKRFKATYFSQYPGVYYTGDGAYQDEEGLFWITGRIDDVINVSGHRLGTAEIESALVLHPQVAEAAVVGIPHSIKGQSVYAYVTLVEGGQFCPDLLDALNKGVKDTIGKFAVPQAIQFAPELPKTRSGKIMRRLLRKIALNELEELGDVSTLANRDVLDTLIQGRKENQAMVI